ncbi:hypothetical protein KIH86_25015 [Paenibacillus sp. HN-1]|uniref:hypothetical protein n=1 Tax=Paenibacillus TaxID=44249 RepID=UPI001CA97ECC|nr:MULTISPECIES: hypothetical protein [Paenibacillus]MBY9077623.1 hypothetical protein [Paenibacillus sp. CGMCC 1.18879]MBY9087452.1 hypothetical protein [Paenibacillus sinensis]
MKPYVKVSIAAGLLVTAIWGGSLLSNTAQGADVGNQPGTADDPVVTKSYVDQQIQKALQGGAVVSTPAATQTPTATASPTAPASTSSMDSSIVDVKPGQTLIASAGTEFIVRAGKAVIVSQDANGVADLTDGLDLTNGQVAPQNHLLSFPRDGRGITVQSGQTLGLVVMVRGGYTLK